MTGWIKLHREIVEHEVFYDVTAFRLFTYLLAKAAFTKTKVAGVAIERGQYLRSYSKLAEDLQYKEGRGMKEYSRSTITRTIKKLTDAGMIETETHKHGTLFTVVNYASYQGLDAPQQPFAEQSRNEDGTITEQTANEHGTKAEPKEEVKELEEFKEVKEEKEKEIPSADAKAPQVETVAHNIAVDFYHSILVRDPHYKKPNLTKWAQEIQKLLQEGRTEQEIRFVMDFIDNDHFERANVLSPHKLRMRYSNLLLKAQRPKHTFGKQETVPTWLQPHYQASPVQQETAMDFEEERKKVLALLNATGKESIYA